jgi:hypothetical protein
MEGRNLSAQPMKKPMEGGNPRFIVISWATAVGYRRSLLGFRGLIRNGKGAERTI